MEDTKREKRVIITKGKSKTHVSTSINLHEPDFEISEISRKYMHLIYEEKNGFIMSMKKNASWRWK